MNHQPRNQPWNPQAPAALVRRDPRFQAIVKAAPRPNWGRPESVFQALGRAILYQQLAGAAALSIYNRLVASFPRRRRFPTPKQVFEAPERLYRSAGVSQAKERYLRDLAAHFLDGRIQPRTLSRRTPEDIRATITQVAGIGDWTADIFLISALGHADILPALDLGIRKGVQRLDDLEELPSVDDVAIRGEAWSPYRSTAAWYLWRILDSGRG